jgi:hypothetical protein
VRQTYISLSGREIAVPPAPRTSRKVPVVRYERTLRARQRARLDSGHHPLNGLRLATEADARCGNCVHLREHHHRRTYYKCAEFGASHGPRTDVRLRWPGCELWRRSPKVDL